MPNLVDGQYLDLLSHILRNGDDKSNRTGIDTRSVFGYQMSFKLGDGFPILTTKKVHFRSVVYELLWFISGSSNIEYLNDNGVTIWDEWADENGELGPVYGVQWRNWNGIDQLKEVISQIRSNPDSRRIIMSAWNVSDIPKMALPPCHLLTHFNVTNGKLSCLMYQRSVDTFLGLPFNISSYSLLTHMVAHVCNLEVGNFVWCGGDVHIYHNHFEQVDTQLKRTPFTLPKLVLNEDVKEIDDFKYEDIHLVDYQCHSVIKAPIAV